MSSFKGLQRCFSTKVLIAILTHSKLLSPAILATATLLLTMMPAQAGYVPPKGGPPAEGTVAGGSRSGCEADSELPSALLSPFYHVGQTTTPTPTLVWFVPAAQPYRIQLNVYQITPGQPIQRIYQQEHVEQTGGLGTLALTAADIAVDNVLKPGEEYAWEMLIACDPGSILFDEAVVSQLRIVPPSKAMLTELEAASTAVERADIYASNGYWYDAIQEGLVATEEDATTWDTVANLLTDLGQQEMEAGLSPQHGLNLREIASELQTGEIAILGAQQTSDSIE
ncbi:MAG: DUF928 domain-containing protein [Leptolyngbya sp. SIO3F4]|nr:DUF928 domain-containing protein [Leptolyngbya sp. SIO3F4]